MLSERIKLGLSLNNIPSWNDHDRQKARELHAELGRERAEQLVQWVTTVYNWQRFRVEHSVKATFPTPGLLSALAGTSLPEHWTMPARVVAQAELPPLTWGGIRTASPTVTSSRHLSAPDVFVT